MDWWTSPLTALLAGRRVVVATSVAAAATRLVGQLRTFGATDVLVVATGGPGAGTLPDAQMVIVDRTTTDPDADEMDRIRSREAALADPPPSIVAAVEAFDPDRTAVVLGPFLGTVGRLCGRPLLAYRRPEWVALEDKTTVDALFDDVGVARAPSVVVPLDEAATRRHALDAGAGTVWALDATAGVHGGGTGTRWVVDDADAARVTAEFAPRGHRVRIMPFLDGVAASVHGIVLPDGVVVLRPVELVSLRRGRDLVYAGCTTFWDPPEGARERMRAAARQVGEWLRARVGFRGAFTLDGVATADGWFPTELNPRSGAGLVTIERAVEGLPLQPLLDLVVAGRELGIGAAELERRLVEAADAARGGGTWMFEASPTSAWDRRSLTFRDGHWAWSDDGADAAATVVSDGRFVRCDYIAAQTPVGPATGARAAAFWRFLEDAGLVAVGDLAAAPDLPRERGEPLANR